MILILLSSILAVYADGTIVAFGDWGSPEGAFSLHAISGYISRTIEQKSARDFVCLLGDNFYPSGINPSLGFRDPKFRLFSDRLARNISTTFYTVLGNHDYLLRGEYYQYAFNTKDRRWVAPGPVSVRTTSIDDTHKLCIWGIDSILFNTASAIALDRAMNSTSCHWTIVMSHYPIYSFGQYRDSARVKTFRQFMLPVIKKHKVHLFLAGHDHSTQVIRANGSWVVIAGSAVDVRPGFIDPGFGGNSGAHLVWSHDVGNGIVVKLTYSVDSLDINIVDVFEDKVLFNEGINP